MSGSGGINVSRRTSAPTPRRDASLQWQHVSGVVAIVTAVVSARQGAIDLQINLHVSSAFWLQVL